MTLDELTGWLDGREEWDYQVDDKGVLVRNTRLETLTHCSFNAIERNSIDTLMGACTHGKDVDHITRVTGYFSRTSGWNKGKAAELKDRHRSKV